MNQRFIELGEGFGDLFELQELISSNSHRFLNGFIFTTEAESGQPVLSVAAVFSPAGRSNFMPIYICREGIQAGSKRAALFEEAVTAAGRTPITLDVKPSYLFAETKLYYQYLTGILRLHHLLPPLQ